jgi:hypothetical protein
MVTFEETADDDDHDCRYDSYDAEERQAMTEAVALQALGVVGGDFDQAAPGAAAPDASLFGTPRWQAGQPPPTASPAPSLREFCPAAWHGPLNQIEAMGLGANQLLVVQLLDKHSGDVARVVGELLG